MKNYLIIAADFTEATELIKQNIPLCIIAVESMFCAEVPAGMVDHTYSEGDETGDAIAGALGILTGKLLDAYQFSLLISTGGDTSMAICRHYGISGIEPLEEICPGIPIGRIIGGKYNNRYIITKSGRFGNKKTLVEIMDYLGILCNKKVSDMGAEGKKESEV